MHSKNTEEDLFPKGFFKQFKSKENLKRPCWSYDQQALFTSNLTEDVTGYKV